MFDIWSKIMLAIAIALIVWFWHKTEFRDDQ